MSKIVKGVLPYDPIAGKAYVCAVGSNDTEAAVNMSMICVDDDTANRIEYVECSIAFTYPKRIET